jgi:tetratricopeptide (TPR) repeat protein
VAFDRDKFLESAQRHVEKNRFDKAIADLKTVLAKDPRDARALQKLGEVEIKCGRFAEAVDTLETLGRVLSDGGFAQRAIAVYQQIHEIIATRLPGHAVRYGHIAPKLAELYRGAGLNREALVVYEQHATSLEQSGRSHEALGMLHSAAELDRENPLAHLRLGEALARTGDLEGGARALENAASLLLQLGRRDDTIAVLERLLSFRTDPINARRCAELYLGRARAPHDGLHALGKLQICVAASPQDADLLGLVARAFDLAGEREKALAVRSQLARMSPRMA